jgi:hypothetical protein
MNVVRCTKKYKEKSSKAVMAGVLIHGTISIQQKSSNRFVIISSKNEKLGTVDYHSGGSGL